MAHAEGLGRANDGGPGAGRSEIGPIAPAPADPPREPSPLQAAGPQSANAPVTGDDEPGIGLDRDPDRLGGGRFRMAFVVVLTGVVLLFALLIAVWMYWLGGQLPRASMPAS